MADVVARLKIKGKNFEILVDLDKALEFKKGQGSIQEVVLTEEAFSDLKKGLRVSEDDLKDCFGSTDFSVIAERIVKHGEVQTSQEHREKEQEGKVKQVIEFLSKNAIDPRTNKPYTPTVIESALKSSGVNIENKPIEQQLSNIISKLREQIPIRIETKKISIQIPATYSGKVYGLLQSYKEKEEWLNDGTLVATVNIPVGLQMDFYDKLNSMTHGSAVAEEVK